MTGDGSDMARQAPERCSSCNAYGWHVQGCPAAGPSPSVVAPVSGDVRGELIEAMQSIPDDRFPLTPTEFADALLPVVERIARKAEQRGAEKALRDAADAAEGMHDPAAPDCVEWADWLRARADAAVGGDQ